ncbi:hypothetical protein COW36_11545 [bacterium (Candidatus Blackallbacteria) CG17_big_fil_post_rev_8_21_14_2_50_48_46]|uniref:PKD domain-containing protein n=1 Tax=bacterium (Candidatus Blackallbacteria) CG17_big_fil_post_rev_8_21_14_2_50_48_46 TaxID=2014261 RepID=A0A2M7G4D8_9BACT|nr:MAG: hypothetical protein COW64_21765 [bacterium (Candidatus Blackallbacteria) CG18_big_fil_WC_8_21_14_2_50_49_26]PIW16771.1 MAG: hypothetical protein COW36_11545 [bacterium (Candidatus Blackallbacteria) CG17_big_fil_post_rev_8_21_14_2_50_48_46]PIW49563.1 MAG: hypothetical protein COW20_05465 [bacterium (Candidatus Blackallbacteria) CG13_big_fil_rev_8_21_14_2_50_49_14]
MNVAARFLPVSLICLLGLSACDTPLGLTAQFSAARQTTLRATLQASASGQVLALADPSALPEGLKQAREIKALLDNSNTLYPVTRNADGSLLIPLPAGRIPDSSGRIEVILTDENRQTYFLKIETGPLLRLSDPGIQVSPAQGILPGSRVALSLNPIEKTADLSAYYFNWSYAAGAQGPWVALSGSDSSLTWEPSQPGNYYLRVETVEKQSKTSTIYTSPVALVNVLDSRRIAETIPASGAIRLGQLIQLKAALPDAVTAQRYRWSYSQSPVGPFSPISDEGERIDWEPKLSGAYYLRLQVFSADGTSATYTSSDSMVQVSEADDAIQTEPASGALIRGEEVLLKASIPGELPAQASYRWFYSNSAQGPFSPINGETQNVRWSPEQTGEFYLRVRMYDPQSQQERTFTSSKVQVSVRDSDDSFALSPQPASLIRGQAVQIQLKRPATNRSVSWLYASTPQGPFTSIAGQGPEISWSPALAGSFYLRAELSGNNQPKSAYTSATALVTVAEGSNVIQTEPNHSIGFGNSLTLTANTPLKGADLRYTWSYGVTPAGPWLPAQSLSEDPQARSIVWYPPQSGSFYLKTDVVDAASGTRQSFVSSTSLAFVTDNPAFFQTSPAPAAIGTQGAVTLTTRFTAPSPGFIYAWSYSLAPTGPFTAIGGSLQPQITWKQPGLAGNYYIKFDAIDTVLHRTLSFTSSNPLVFVSESQTSTLR